MSKQLKAFEIERLENTSLTLPYDGTAILPADVHAPQDEFKIDCGCTNIAGTCVGSVCEASVCGCSENNVCSCTVCV